MNGIKKSYSTVTVTASQSPVADTGIINVSADISGLTSMPGLSLQN